VPGRYANTAVKVEDNGGNVSAPPVAVVASPPVSVVPPTAPIVLTPGRDWWTYPVGSPERAAAQYAATQNAAEVRQRATDAGVVEENTYQGQPQDSGSRQTTRAEDAAAKRQSDACSASPSCAAAFARQVGVQLYNNPAGPTSGTTRAQDAANAGLNKACAQSRNCMSGYGAAEGADLGSR